MAGSALVLLSLVSKPFVLFGLFQQPGFERGGCRVHDFPALFEHVATPLGRLHLVPDRMGESHLGDFARKRSALGRPIAERRAEARSLLWLSSIRKGWGPGSQGSREAFHVGLRLPVG